MGQTLRCPLGYLSVFVCRYCLFKFICVLNEYLFVNEYAIVCLLNENVIVCLLNENVIVCLLNENAISVQCLLSHSNDNELSNKSTLIFLHEFIYYSYGSIFII